MVLAEAVAVVTGASSGIGAAVALALAQRGVRVTATARRSDRLAMLAEQAATLGGRVQALAADLSSELAIREVFRQSEEQWGRLDILVNSAGVGIVSNVANGSVEAWRTMWEVNVLATAIAMQEALRRFPPDGGHIINVGSTSGHRVSSADAGFYAATKFAVRGLTDAVRYELRVNHSRTRISLLSPGRVNTDLFRDGQPPAAAAGSYPQLTPEDVAELVLQLLQTPPNVEINEVIVRPRDQVQ